MRVNWVLVAVGIGLVLRLLTLNSALSFDEFVQTKAVLEANEYGLDKSTEMNPLTTWTRLLMTGFLGVHVWSLRFASLIFAALTAWVLFLLAKELYGKKAARWAVALLALSAWHALVSTSISFDGAFLAFYTSLTMYCFVKHEKTRELRWLLYCGIAFGLCVLTKYTGVLVFFALLAYAAAVRKSIRHTARCFSIIGLVGAATFSVFPIIAFLFSDPSYFWITLRHGTGYFGGREVSIALLAIQYALALLWIGPLMLFGYFLSWKNRQKQDWLGHSLIFVVLLFYTIIVQDPFRPVERYFTVFLPVLCMLVGRYFASLKLERRHWIAFGIVLAASLALNFPLNALPGKILPFYPKTGFIDAVLGLDWNFFVPFTGDQGPVGLYVKFAIFALAWTISALLFAPALRQKRWAAISLLAVGLGLSVFMMTELALHTTSPDISKVVQETASFVKSARLSGPFYTFRDYAMQYHLGAQATNIDFDADPTQVREMLSAGGTLVVIDFPALDKQGELWKAFTACQRQAVIEDKGIALGHVFRC